MKISKLLCALLAASLFAAGCDNDSEEKANVTLTPNSAEMSADGGSATVTLTATRAWTASFDASEVSVSPTEGDRTFGTRTITIKVLKNKTTESRDVLVTFKAGSASAEFIAHQQAGEPEVEPEPQPEPVLGDGSKEKPYTVAQALEIAKDAPGSATKKKSKYVYVKGIVSNVKSYDASYGNIEYFISDDGTESAQIQVYHGVRAGWEIFETGNEIKAGDTALVFGEIINYSGNTPEINYGQLFGLNDQTFVSTEDAAPSSKDFKNEGTTSCGWLELPETKADDGCDFYAHYMTLSTGEKRNYAFYFNKTDRLSHWVAYPLNKSLIGSGVRDENPFGYDPMVSQDDQPNLSKTFLESGTYDRGHQIPSADRYAGNANNQTFYATNMTPQIGKLFNQGLWGKAEAQVRTWARKCDTLFVVTGCVIAAEPQKAHDRESNKEVSVPDAYFKAVLRYQKTADSGIAGTDGKYSALAMYFEHKDYSNSAFDKSYTLSVDELEKKLGYDLFVNLPKRAGESAAAAIEAEVPTENTWWWEK